MTAMKNEEIDRDHYLKNLKHCRFDIGYYDEHQRSIYSEIPKFEAFDDNFLVKDGQCYAVLKDPSSHLGVRYIVLKEANLSAEI